MDYYRILGHRYAQDFLPTIDYIRSVPDAESQGHFVLGVAATAVQKDTPKSIDDTLDFCLNLPEQYFPWCFRDAVSGMGLNKTAADQKLVVDELYASIHAHGHDNAFRAQ